MTFHLFITNDTTVAPVLSPVPVSENSWFTGYAWRVATCPSCRAHIGWKFEPEAASAGSQSFFALVLDYLIEYSSS